MYLFIAFNRYSQELLDKVKEMADGIVVEDAPVFKTRDEIIKQQQVRWHSDCVLAPFIA